MWLKSCKMALLVCFTLAVAPAAIKIEVSPMATLEAMEGLSMNQSEPTAEEAARRTFSTTKKKYEDEKYIEAFFGIVGETGGKPLAEKRAKNILKLFSDATKLIYLLDQKIEQTEAADGLESILEFLNTADDLEKHFLTNLILPYFPKFDLGVILSAKSENKLKRIVDLSTHCFKNLKDKDNQCLGKEMLNRITRAEHYEDKIRDLGPFLQLFDLAADDARMLNRVLKLFELSKQFTPKHEEVLDLRKFKILTERFARELKPPSANEAQEAKPMKLDEDKVGRMEQVIPLICEWTPEFYSQYQSILSAGEGPRSFYIDTLQGFLLYFKEVDDVFAEIIQLAFGGKPAIIEANNERTKGDFDFPMQKVENMNLALKKKVENMNEALLAYSSPEVPMDKKEARAMLETMMFFMNGANFDEESFEAFAKSASDFKYLTGKSLHKDIIERICLDSQKLTGKNLAELDELTGKADQEKLTGQSLDKDAIEGSCLNGKLTLNQVRDKLGEDKLGEKQRRLAGMQLDGSFKQKQALKAEIVEMTDVVQHAQSMAKQLIRAELKDAANKKLMENKKWVDAANKKWIEMGVFKIG